VNHITEGQMAGGTITFEITSTGELSSLVTAMEHAHPHRPDQAR